MYQDPIPDTSVARSPPRHASQRLLPGRSDNEALTESDQSFQLISSRPSYSTRQAAWIGTTLEADCTYSTFGGRSDCAPERGIILEEINMPTGWTCPEDRGEPSSEAKRFELLKAQISQGASCGTKWTRPGPNTRREGVYLGPYGQPTQLEPTFANPFGYVPRLPPTTDVSQVHDLVNLTGLKRRVDGELNLSLISPEKKIKLRQGGEASSSPRGRKGKGHGIEGRRRYRAQKGELFSEENLLEVKIIEATNWRNTQSPTTTELGDGSQGSGGWPQTAAREP